MYKVKYYNDYIYIPGDKEYTVLNPELEREKNKAGKLSFTIFDDHPLYGQLNKLKCGIIVKDGMETIFKGRIIDTEQSFDKSINYTVEGKLAVLNDSPCRPYEFQGAPEDLLSYLIENHNAQVSEEQQFKIGIVTVTDPNNYVSFSWKKTETTWNLIKSRLLDKLGGFLVLRYEDDGDYLDWIAEITTTAEQKVEFGENLLDLSLFIDATSTYTACIPYGANDEEGQPLTISSVNNNKDFIINDSMAAEYGVIYAPCDETTWEDVTRPENLLSKAKEWLSTNGIMFNSSVDLSFIDLSKMGIQADKIELCTNVKIVSKPHNFETIFLVEKINEKLDVPEDVRITINHTKKTLTDDTLGAIKLNNETLQRVEIIENTSADYVTNDTIEAVYEDIQGKVVSLSSEIEQTSENISISVAQTYATKDEVKTQNSRIDVLSDQVAITVETANNINTTFDFTGEGLRIGRSDAEIYSIQDNDSYEFRNKSNEKLLSIGSDGIETPTAVINKQISYFNQWSMRKGAYIEGVGYNLNDLWIGG